MGGTSSADGPHSYADLRAWPDDTRWEIIDGRAYAMVGPSWRHQAVVMGLAAQLLAYFRERGCRVLPAPLDVRLARGDEPDDAIDTVVQPDISVVCDLSKLDERGCRGAPKLIVEVISPSTAGRDHIVKRSLYEAHGVHQYWLVHPVDRLVTIYRRARQGDASFAAPELSEARGVVSIAGYEELEVNWDQVFADIPAEVDGR